MTSFVMCDGCQGQTPSEEAIEYEIFGGSNVYLCPTCFGEMKLAMKAERAKGKT